MTHDTSASSIWLRQVLTEQVFRHVSTKARQRALGKQEVVMTTKVHREFESLSPAADRTGLSIRTLRRRMACGELAAYRICPRAIRVALRTSTA